MGCITYKDLKINLILILFILVSNFCVGQEVLFEIPLEDDVEKVNIENSHYIDQDDGAVLVLNKGKTSDGILLDEKSNLLTSISSINLPRKYTKIIGHTIEEKKARIYYKSSKKFNIASILYDFERGITSQYESEQIFKNEDYIGSYSQKDKFFLVTIKKNSNLLKIYRSDSSGEFIAQSFELEGDFQNDRGTKTRLYNIMSNASDFSSFNSSYVKVRPINSNVPNAIAIASLTNKLYSNENGFVISLDKNKNYTYLIDLNFSALECNIRMIEKPKLKEDDIFSKSNSFISGDRLFQFNSSKEEFVVSVKDLKTGADLKKVKFGIGDDLKPIEKFMFEDAYDSSGRIKESIKSFPKFLKKISAIKNGISVFENKGVFEIKIGGIDPKGFITNASISNTSRGFSSSGSLLDVTFNSWLTTKSLYAEVFLDGDLNFLEQSANVDVFEKIKKFIDERSDQEGSLLFAKDREIFYGWLDNESKKLVVTSFDF